MNRAEILDTAKGYVTRDRAATHGRAEDQFATIGQLWGTLLGVEVTPAKVALMMAALKLVRAWGNPAHLDSWTDGCGYFACGGEIATSSTLPREGLPFDVVKAERDAAREEASQAMAEFLALGSGVDFTDANGQKWVMLTPEDYAASDSPAAPVGSPPEGQGDVSATHAAKDAEGTPAARVCGGCRWMGSIYEDTHGTLGGKCAKTGLANWVSWTCDEWQPKPAARDATAWQAQDSGVEG